ncbi:MAG: hypothetical protein ACUVV4_04560 [Candidatus Bathyarchaeia archaeon]
MGRRRKKEEKIIRKTLPDFYLCPNCGKNTMKATLNKKEGKASIICGNCGLKKIIGINNQMEEVDAYNRFIDSYYGGK